MKRLYHYRGKRNRFKHVFISRMKSINKHIKLSSAKEALNVVYEFDVAIQKARQSAMNLPEYASGGETANLPDIVGEDGLPEFIQSPD